MGREVVHLIKNRSENIKKNHYFHLAGVGALRFVSFFEQQPTLLLFSPHLSMICLQRVFKETFGGLCCSEENIWGVAKGGNIVNDHQ